MIFNYIVRVGKAKYGDVFYDINLGVDSYLPHAKGASDINESTPTDKLPQPSSESKWSDVKTSQEKPWTPSRLKQ